jgi:hypothetical protein
MCCGSKRLAIRAGSVPLQSWDRQTDAGTPSEAIAIPRAQTVTFHPLSCDSVPASPRWVRLVCLQNELRIRGPVTGRLYEFLPGQTRAVDRKDAAVMMRSGLFSR